MFFSSYLLCPSCSGLIEDHNLALVEVAAPCPRCGSSGQYRQLWPTFFGHVWMNAICSKKTDSVEDRFFLTVMICSCSEHMLQALIVQMLRRQGASEQHIDIMLDAHDGQQRMKNLFKAVGGCSFQEACEELDQKQFAFAWQRLVQARNIFAHGVPPGPGLRHDPDEKDLLEVRDNLLKVFAGLHNRFVARAKAPGGATLPSR